MTEKYRDKRYKNYPVTRVAAGFNIVILRRKNIDVLFTPLTD
ncbi:hypothetical protein TPE_0708 [Treponema pedis str. T A4]|uniref:Uncharacterized protein n=1 Tax=Treponema pedis str. T A4 TaxID=1291379 RepID=S6A848_9SPIR|nr:hypothetical protein TPE_0708 [Treponema pedis str. T A4]